MLTRLLALQHADTAFPSGSFAFSNGVEGLCAMPMPFGRDALRAFVEATLKHRWAGTDRRALVHAARSGGCLERLATIDNRVEAATLSEPLRSGSRRAGRALLTSHVRLGTPGAEAIMAALAGGRLKGHIAMLQGCLWRALGLHETDAEAMAGYQAIAGLASAGVRLGCIGALDAQAVISDSLPVLERILSVPVSAAPIDYESFAPLADIASMRRASGSRLFSN